ncbi:uncharacterized protein LOC128679854 isoform X2 [Plodia interpunctella]|uniref:uncharacterized protein LOC128679854 isoform X2 n=1 Tax=Plodia interpunctella TaxID=58824 RepID=UPI002368E5C1|nr:uncharacterized protein LOC128679854 isoform X2 [Plodia interpunctella]
MYVKLVLLLVAILSIVFVNADFYFNHPQPKPEDLNRLHLKCVPGRTVIKVSENVKAVAMDESSYEDDFRRTHMNFGAKDDEQCEICVCSAEGKDEYCSKRPAMNVNECIVMARANDEFNKNIPFDVDRVLANRVRRRGADQQCVPYVSKYSTCTDENSCAGCKECNCDERGQWVCEDVTRCFGMDSRDMDENTVDMAWDAIEETFKKKNREYSAKLGTPHVPRPQIIGGEDELLGDLEKEKYVGSDVEPLQATNIQEFMNMQIDSIKDKLNDRLKRSVDHKNKTKSDHPIKFYHTVDEVNEDVLKHSNDSGTIVAKKAVANFPVQVSRRSERLNGNKSSNPLHIEYKSKLYEHHIADNKIDTHPVIETKSEVREKLHEIMKNKTKEVKDKDLSKLIVNELHKGIEIVGDKKSPSISNITFVRENDTLTAMAFIAGNLLNKLWHLEQDKQDEMMDSEVLKHEKIADLVELFKEPLTIRQETFLKGALEHLANVMTKGNDDKNMPLCEQVEKIKSELGVSKNCSLHDHSDKQEHADKKEKHEDSSKILRTRVSNDATLAAIDKLNNVMALLQKYEEVQKNIYNIKSHGQHSSVQQVGKNVPTSRSELNRMDQILTDSENQSLNLYGNILGKITKLLVPIKKQNNIITTIKNQNIFKDDEDLKSKLKRIYDIDLENSTFTSKDKVVLDYLVNLRNKNCKITENGYDPSIADGDIIQNLSDFLRIKSFTDLVKLLEPEKKTTTTTTTTANFVLRSNTDTTTQVPASTLAFASTTTTTANPNAFKGNLVQTKEKLKAHLKAIIGDLIELQKATGISSREGNIKIAEALPCLYNILNNNKMVEDKIKYQLNKVKSVFDSIKEELKYNPSTRRVNTITEPRPKSAVIWERVIKNAELNPKTRRQMVSQHTRPKSFDEVKILINSMNSSTNDYKNTAILKGVSPQKRLTLLKTIDVDARIYIGILEKIKLYMEEITTLNPKIGITINNFLNKSILNLKLDEDVLNNLYKHKATKKAIPKVHNFKNYQQSRAGALTMPSNTKSKTVKLSRDDIINQLIKNRVQFYLKVKALEDEDEQDDINVRLAKRILNYLETKNYTIARELFKVFVAQKQQSKSEAYALPKYLDVKPKTKQKGIMALKEPLIQFQEERAPYMGSDMSSLTQSLMKQLTNIKNMRS